MFPLDKKQILNLAEKDLDTLCFLDSEGLLLGVDESFSAYKLKILRIYNEITTINTKLRAGETVYIDKNIILNRESQLSESKYINPNFLLTQKYGFRATWVLSFFYKNIGLFSGACTLAFSSGFSCILLSHRFKYKDTWLIYALQEIVTHELCHAVRGPIKDNKLEEFFAYNCSKSIIRRYFGNCFRSSLDSFLFLLPIFLLFVVELYKTYFFAGLNTLYFWVLAVIYPSLLLIRNQISISNYKKAQKYMIESGFSSNHNVAAILFRCSYDEIKQIAKFFNNRSRSEDWFYNKINTEFRWKIIFKRFFIPGKIPTNRSYCFNDQREELTRHST